MQDEHDLATARAKAVRRQLRGFVRAAAPPKKRSLREFAESCVYLAEGPFQGRRFRCETLPWAGLLFDAIDSRRYSWVVCTGCVQGGKTLSCYVIPVLWHLFEHRETVVAGVPDMKIAYDKWRTELKPAIEASPGLSELLPDDGPGSKGGQFNAIRFRHGPELKFMSGGGGDQNRSHYTTRVVAVTEADRLDDRGASSREAAKILQLVGRTASYGDLARLYAECTPTSHDGFVWSEYVGGTASVILKPCPHCGEYVAPEREHFVGWEDAEGPDQAAELARFRCPACAGEIDDQQRRLMCERGVLCHAGQRVNKRGRVLGPHPPTRTLGFRFAAFDNLLWTSGVIARKCWAASRDADAESAELALRQWCWVQPAEPELKEMAPLTLEEVLGRSNRQPGRGEAPEWAELVTCGVDLRATQLHFVLMAWSREGLGHLVECGVVPVERERFGVEKGLRIALERLRGLLTRGVPRVAGDKLPVGWTLVDSGWKTDVVRWFVRRCRQEGERRFLVSFGRGAAAGPKAGAYRHPAMVTKRTPQIGDQYYLAWSPKHQLHAAMVNVDYWKTVLRERLATPTDQPGSLTVFDAVTDVDQSLLRQFARHVTAERPVEKVVPGRGPVTVWENVARAPNHWLDCATYATAAAHLYGVRVLDETPPVEEPGGPLLPPVAGPGGRVLRLRQRGD